MSELLVSAHYSKQHGTKQGVTCSANIAALVLKLCRASSRILLRSIPVRPVISLVKDEPGVEILALPGDADAATAADPEINSAEGSLKYSKGTLLQQ